MRTPLRRIVPVVLCSAAVAVAQPAREPVDLDAMNRIRAEGLRRSQVMATLEDLVDRHGPRLTASPEGRAAAEWARAKLAAWGLSNAHLEPFDFGEGWSFSKSSLRVTAPFVVPMYAIPKAWTPGTGGVVRGSAVHVKLESDEDFTEQKGKLRGKIVLLSDAHEPSTRGGDRADAAPLRRFSRDELDELARYPIPGEKVSDWYARSQKRWATNDKLNRFLVEEGALATVEISWQEEGVITASAGGSRGVPGRSRGVPDVVIAAEPYQRLLRLLAKDVPVELELEVEAQFETDDQHGYNVVAELPGRDPKSGVVMLGAHLDAWHAATGTTDNGAGVAAVMEAVRILEAAGLKPRRTVRVALWSGEEQGDIGSHAYVRQHFADRPDTTDAEEAKLPRWIWRRTFPIQVKPEHAGLSAYFNLDNGSGRIRGVYAQSNVAAAPIFEAWLAPLRDLGADTVVTQDTDATDHEEFDDVGLPAFQFVQDDLDYESRTHHTTLDTFEHARRDDLIQASVVLAAFAWDAAERERPLPRKPMPQAPPATPEKKPAAKPTPAATTR